MIKEIKLLKIKANDPTDVLQRLYEKLQKLGINLPSEKEFKDEGSKLIKSRLRDLWAEVKSCYIELDYNETAWKDMISLYYVHTNPIISTRVMRVHLFKYEKNSIQIQTCVGDDAIEYVVADKDVRDSYLGYFNLRPLGTPSVILSYVMPNYLNFKPTFDNTSINMLTYDRKVHLAGVTFHTKVFPFFSGESIVAVCAHCSLVMLSRYMYRAMRLNELRLSMICSVDKQATYPSYGLSLKDIMEIFSSNRINVRTYTGSVDNSRPDPDSYPNDIIKNLVFSMLDSNIPVLLAFCSHIILLCGSSYDPSGCERYIAMYDDSGAFAQSITRNGAPSQFLSFMKWRNLIDYCAKEGEEELYALFPSYPRVTIDYIALMELLNNDEIDSIRRPNRVLLLDCNKTKTLLLECLDNITEWLAKLQAESRKKDTYISSLVLKNMIDVFLEEDTSHYYWWVEYVHSDRKATQHWYLMFDTVKTTSLHITNYCFNFIINHQKAIDTTKATIKSGYKSHLDSWLKAAGKYRMIYLPFNHRIDA